MDSKRTSRTWSLSRRSSDSVPIKLTREEKRRTKMTSNVDPTRAITEDEPFAVSQSKPSVGLRGHQFKDIYGNIITEPDLSNPTRSRWERPLETIKSFEAAINMDARRQSAFYVVDTIDSMDHSQRQAQHTPGPFDPSLYHRNHGAQRYAPVDPYESRRNSYSGSEYGRPMMPAARGHGDRRSLSRTPSLADPYSNRSMEQQPPMTAYSDGRTQSLRNRSAPHGDFRRYNDQSYQQYSSSMGSAGHDSHNYNSDPASEASSLGSNNVALQPRATPLSKEYENMFSFSNPEEPSQLDFQSPATPGQLNGLGYGSGNGNGNGPANGESRDHWMNGSVSRYSNNPFLNGNQQANGSLYHNGTAAGNDGNANGGGGSQPPVRRDSVLRKPVSLSNGNNANGDGASQLPMRQSSVLRKSVPPSNNPAASSRTPAAVTQVAPPVDKQKKRGLFKRFSRS